MAENLQPLIFEAMSDPSFYPHGVHSLSQEETHISKVFLTGRYVYKIKKPVDLGFVDFRDIERRRFFCEQEVVLNQRLTQDVYLGVVSICFDGHSFRIDGAGKPAEYAVKMRQLPAGRTLECLLAAGLTQPEDIDRLAAMLADFHKACLVSCDLSVRQYLQMACTENFRQIMPLAGRLLDAGRYDYVRAATFNYFIRNKGLLERRIASGFFRNGHGDLRAEHIYYMEDGRIQILDCIEFNERLRLVDLASDLAFLIMDLEYRHQSECARLLLEAYYRRCEDTSLLSMMDFYKCYRAMVRCKVNCIHLSAQNLDPERRDDLVTGARQYLRLAHGYARRFNRPTLWIFCGLPATGKSALASQAAELLGIEAHNSDRIRKRLCGIDPFRHVDGPVDEGMYAPEVGTRVYDQLLAAAKKSVHEGCSVILDATYSCSSHRQKLCRLANGCGARILFVESRAPDAVLRSRLQQRESSPSVSDARLAHFDILKARFEPLVEILPERHIVLDTTKTAEACLRDLFAAAFVQR